MREDRANPAQYLLTARPSLPPNICAIYTGKPLPCRPFRCGFLPFTVRASVPDMFFHLFMRALQRGDEVPLFR